MIAETGLLMLLASVSSGAIELSSIEPQPTAGLDTIIRLERDGRTAVGVVVKATYRQNAAEVLVKEQEIGVTDTYGTVRWTPLEAGVVVLGWEGGSRNIAVRYDGTPGAAVEIAVIAGLLLIGGSILFFIRMLREGSGDLPDTRRPET